MLKYVSRGFNGKKMRYKFGAWNVRTVLKGGALRSLITQLLNCEVSSHTGYWIDRWRLNMGL